MGTYQLLGLLDRDSLVVLSPNQPPAVTLLNPASQAQPEDNGPAIERAIAAYQTAQDFFSGGRLKRQQVEEAFLPLHQPWPAIGGSPARRPNEAPSPGGPLFGK